MLRCGHMLVESYAPLREGGNETVVEGLGLGVCESGSSHAPLYRRLKPVRVAMSWAIYCSWPAATMGWAH